MSGPNTEIFCRKAGELSADLIRFVAESGGDGRDMLTILQSMVAGVVLAIEADPEEVLPIFTAGVRDMHKQASAAHLARAN